MNRLAEYPPIHPGNLGAPESDVNEGTGCFVVPLKTELRRTPHNRERNDPAGVKRHGRGSAHRVARRAVEIQDQGP